MAIYGSVIVNHRPIAEWEARRLTTDLGDDPDGIFEYAWRYRDGRGALLRGNLWHKRGDGAAMLVAAVMMAARTCPVDEGEGP